jgi:ribonuclease HI
MKRVEIVVDGGMIGSNPGKGGWGGRFRVYIDDTLADERFFGEAFGTEIVTNNVAEWRAINGAMMRCIEYYWDADMITIVSDSKLAVQQANNRWQCKDDHLYQLKQIYCRLRTQLCNTKLEIKHKRRKHTECAHDHIAQILGRSK